MPDIPHDDSRPRVSRREFLTRDVPRTAALLTAAGAAAKDLKIARKPGRVLGANDRINIAFIGNGMQYMSLLEMFKARRNQKNDVEFLAVCDVWEPRLKHGQETSGAARTYRDYREVLQQPDIDGVVLAVPDHWHYPMAKDALLAGKDVYLEKPMTHTIDEAAKLSDLVQRTGRMLQVGGLGPAQRLNWKVNEYIKAGKMGKVLWGLISYNRNTREGMWDYPIPGIGSEPWPDAKVTPQNLDWNMWLGPAAPKRRFSAERYFRWRKFWDYSTGNAGDLLYHRLGTMSTMIGFDFPTRAVAVGGVYVQKNREVPDTYMTMLEYPGDYSINMISCMGNSTSAPITIYGNWGTLQIIEPHMAMDSMGDQRRAPQNGAAPQRRRESVAVIKAEREFAKEFRDANNGQTEVTIESEPGPSLGDNWLDSMRSREAPFYNAQRGYQVMVGIGLGVESFRTGKIMAFDPQRHTVSTAPTRHREYPPKEA